MNYKDLDIGIRDFIIYLNEIGIETIASCSHKNESPYIAFKSVSNCDKFISIMKTIKQPFGVVRYNKMISRGARKAVLILFNEKYSQEDIDNSFSNALQQLKSISK